MNGTLAAALFLCIVCNVPCSSTPVSSQSAVDSGAGDTLAISQHIGMPPLPPPADVESIDVDANEILSTAALTVNETATGTAFSDTVWVGNWPDRPPWKDLVPIGAAFLAAGLTFLGANIIKDRERRDQLADQVAARAAEQDAQRREFFNLSRALCDEMQRTLDRTWGLVEVVRSRGPIIMDAKETCLSRAIQTMPPDWPVRELLRFYENAGLIAFHHNAALSLPDLWEVMGPDVLDLGRLRSRYEATSDPIQKEQIYSQIRKNIAVGIAVGFACDKHAGKAETMEDQYNVVVRHLAGLAAVVGQTLPRELTPIPPEELARRREVAGEVERRSREQQVRLILEDWHTGIEPKDPPPVP